MSEQQNQQTAALGTAPVGPLLFRLALPTITAQVVNLLYSIVDRIYKYLMWSLISTPARPMPR